jgi:hypothetical protein
MADLTVTVDGREVAASWVDESPKTRQALSSALPVEGEATRWGDELYFGVPVDAPSEPDAREVVEPGTIAYWPRGSALCLFWGPTPASEGSEPRAASPVNVVARLEDLSVLSSLPAGAGATVHVTSN